MVEPTSDGMELGHSDGVLSRAEEIRAKLDTGSLSANQRKKYRKKLSKLFNSVRFCSLSVVACMFACCQDAIATPVLSAGSCGRGQQRLECDAWRGGFWLHLYQSAQQAPAAS